MAFKRNKQGMELSVLAGIILLLVSVGVLAGIYKVAFSQADQKSVELTCRSFNAVRYGIEKGASEQGTIAKLFSKQFNAPRICATIEKQNTVPTKDYQEIGGGKEVQAAYEIRDMMARCWWMWLEGKQQNVFGKGVFDLKDGCFVCYTFSINKEANVGYNNIIEAFQKPYPVANFADNCKTGGSGECKISCLDSERESNSLTCKNKNNQKCCTKTFTYLDYMQGTNGAPTGKGFILFDSKETTLSKDTYAIAMVSPGESLTWAALGTETAAIGVGVGAVVLSLSILSSPVSIPAALGVLAFGGATSQGLAYMAHFSGTVNPKDYNYIVLDKYQNIQNHCYMEKSYGE